jgi:hypothetical protein
MTEQRNPLEEVLYRAGAGDWQAFLAAGLSLEKIRTIASEWTRALRGIEKPWLCWNVDPTWNVIQQRLVKSVGWTPIVGFDPRVGRPPLEKGAVLIDFNERLQLPTMWLHFPIEFIFLYTDRLAYWHADCLIRPEKMRHIADLFSSLPDGTTAAVLPKLGLRERLRRHLRYWELVGCTTRRASESLFNTGCGWWMNFSSHPSTPPNEIPRRAKCYWDSGAGIRYWHKHCGGKVELIPISYVKEGHFTGIGRPDYRRASPKNYKRNLSLELSLNYDLVNCCNKLGLQALLHD